MAYSFIKNKKGGVSVLLDSAADISLVPTDQFFPGTFAFTADGSARYRLSTSRSWVEVAGSGDTPGGGWPEDLPLPSEGGYGYTDEDETVHKIDSKYLPEVGGDFIIEGTASMVESPMPMLLINDLSKTYAETKSAYLSGKTVKVKIDMSNMVFFSNAVGYQSFDGAEAIHFDGSAFQATAGEFESTKSYISFALPTD